MEILGLAIVIVLILVATIFIVRFFVFKTTTDYRKGFISTELASNMLSTFLNTNAEDCFQMTMTELLKDCAIFDGKCDGGGCIKCSNEDSCDFVKTKLQNIFSQTLENWNTKYYEFIVDTSSDFSSPFFDVEGSMGNCAGKEKKSKLQPLPVEISAMTMFVKLDICQ